MNNCNIRDNLRREAILEGLDLMASYVESAYQATRRGNDRELILQWEAVRAVAKSIAPTITVLADKKTGRSP